MASLGRKVVGDNRNDFPLGTANPMRQSSIYEFVDEIDTFPMELQKIDSVFLDNPFAL